MKLIPILTNQVSNSRGKIPSPPKVSINDNLFTLNNRAIIELSKIWGSMDFSLQIYVSECGNHIAFGAREGKADKTGVSKSISSLLARSKLNMKNFYGKNDIPLELKDSLLIGDIANIGK